MLNHRLRDACNLNPNLNVDHGLREGHRDTSAKVRELHVHHCFKETDSSDPKERSTQLAPECVCVGGKVFRASLAPAAAAFGCERVGDA